MVEKVLYKVRAAATGGGRDGRTALDDGSFTTELAIPKELGGPGGDALNPEKLFSLGYAACFLGALRNFAAGRNVEVPEDVTVAVETGIGPREDGGFGLAVDIFVSLPGLEPVLAQELVEGAHKFCPYSHAIGGRLNITPRISDDTATGAE